MSDKWRLTCNDANYPCGNGCIQCTGRPACMSTEEHTRMLQNVYRDTDSCLQKIVELHERAVKLNERLTKTDTLVANPILLNLLNNTEWVSQLSRFIGQVDTLTKHL